MMISPDAFIEEQKDKTYQELLAERNKLIREIKQYESGEESEHIIINPSPDVRYQCNLQYLAKICELIAKKYNEQKMEI